MVPDKRCCTSLCFYGRFTPQGWTNMPSAHTCTLVMLSLLIIGCCVVAHAAVDQKLRVEMSPFASFVMFIARGPAGAEERLQCMHPMSQYAVTTGREELWNSKTEARSQRAVHLCIGSNRYWRAP